MKRHRCTYKLLLKIGFKKNEIKCKCMKKQLSIKKTKKLLKVKKVKRGLPK